MAVLAIALLVSLSGNYIGYRYVHYAIHKYNDSRLDPIGEKSCPLYRMAEGKHFAVLLGDSHAMFTAEGNQVLGLTRLVAHP